MLQRDFNKKPESPKSKGLVNNPFFSIGVVAVSVLLLLLGLQWWTPKSSALTSKEAEELTQAQDTNASPSSPPKVAKDNSSSTTAIAKLQKKIATAPDQQSLEKIQKEIEADSATLVQNTNNKKVYRSLIASIESRKLSISSTKEKTKENPNLNETAAIEQQAQAFLSRLDFDLDASTSFLRNYNGVNFKTLEALESYQAICRHKKDYLFLKAKLEGMKDDSYFEKAEKLLHKKFKYITLDQFDEQNYDWVDKKRPSWLTNAQAEEIKSWWNILDDEIERLDSDY